MATVTPALITALYTTWRADFQTGMAAAPNQWQKIAMQVPSSSQSNTYGWMGKIPGMRE